MRHIRVGIAIVVALAAAIYVALFQPAPEARAADTVFEAESMTISPFFGGTTYRVNTASSGASLLLLFSSTASKTISLPTSSSITVRAMGQACFGAPAMTVAVDGQTVLNTSVTATTWTNYTAPVSVAAGTHTISVSFTNDFAIIICDRNLLVDSITVTGASTTTTPPTTTPPVPVTVIGHGAVGGCGGGPFLSLSDADLAKELDLAKAAGMKAIRLDIDWSAIEEVKGVQTWSSTDRVINAITSRGMTPLGLLTYAPQWASGSTDSHTPPIDPNTFATFAKTAASRYKGKIYAWEIWNEPNIVSFFKPKPNIATYNKLLTGAYTAIKSVDSTLTVISGGLAPAVDNGSDIAPVTFVTGIYSAGANKYLDGVGMHPYTYPYLPNDPTTTAWSAFLQLTPMRAVMVAGGDTAKLVWLTEFGAPTGTDPTAVTEAVQAQTISIVLQSARDTAWLGPALVYNLRDLGTDLSDREQNFGILHYDFTPKQSYDALKTIAIAQP
jgi:polysaccharide biosynthesis protein PslG